MEISDIGWCPACTRNILDFPALQCPWCRSVDPKLALGDLELPDGASPAETMLATTQYIDQLTVRIKSAMTVRAGAARLAIGDPDLPAVAVAAHVKVRSIEKWAEGPKPAHCPKGHDRNEHGEWNGKRWVCRECVRLAPPPKPKATPKPKKTGLRDAWRAHEARMLKRQTLARAGQLPDRLNPPLPPPVERRGTARSSPPGAG